MERGCRSDHGFVNWFLVVASVTETKTRMSVNVKDNNWRYDAQEIYLKYFIDSGYWEKQGRGGRWRREPGFVACFVVAAISATVVASPDSSLDKVSKKIPEAKIWVGTSSYWKQGMHRFRLIMNTRKMLFTNTVNEFQTVLWPSLSKWSLIPDFLYINCLKLRRLQLGGGQAQSATSSFSLGFWLT